MRLAERRTGIYLHWAVAVLTVGLAVATADGPAPGLFIAWAVAVGLLLARALTARPMAHPGPKLGERARLLHLAIFRGFYVVLAAVLILGLLSGQASGEIGGPAAIYDDAWTVLWAFVVVHFAFNVWRSTALGEKPFSTMMP